MQTESRLVRQFTQLHAGIVQLVEQLISKFNREFLRLFSLRCAPLLTLGVSAISYSRRVAQTCAVLQQKFLRP